jgi:hypothetical protein
VTCDAGKRPFAAPPSTTFLCELPMKTAVKKTLVLFVLAAFAAPTLSFAAAEYPANQKRPAYSKTHKNHKHHKKSAE